MRNRYLSFILSAVLYLCISAAYAVGFDATVESNSVNYGDSIRLKLLLSDAKPVEHIDISPLAKDFSIHNQQQFSSYRNINGAVQSETGWHVILMPKKEGEFIIPALTLETDKGRFSTQAIRINVAPPKAGSKKSDDVGISLISIVSKAKAYINEPIIYTLKIVSYKNIANIVLDDIKSNDAIIEKIGEPKQYNQVHGGVSAHIIEIRYAVTALKAGNITITPALMRGELQVPAPQPQRNRRFGLFNDLFLDNLVELKPFSLQSDKITLQIMEPASKSNNWLPLRNLELSEKWDGVQSVKVGDTITRKIKMVAKGAFSKQLPSTNNFMQLNDIKTYANKPNFDDTYNEAENTIIGVREEEYSIVPQQAGNFTLPEVKIQWWNLKTKKFETATLPAKHLKVVAATGVPNANVTIDYSNDNAQQETENAAAPVKSQNSLIYILAGALIGVILSLGAVIIYLIKRKPTLKVSATAAPKVKASQQDAITNVFELRNSILQYAVKHWGVATNTSLNRLGDALTSNNYTYDIQTYNELCENINAALYAKGVATDLEALVQLWQEFKQLVRKTKSHLPEPEKQDYTSINPT